MELFPESIRSLRQRLKNILRTELKLKGADSTLVLIDKHAYKGTLLTMELCKLLNKPSSQADVSCTDEDKQILDG